MSRLLARLALLSILVVPVAGRTATAGSPDAGKATLERFEAVLASTPSATEALGRWCAERRLADPPRIRAERVAIPPVTAAPGVVRAALGAGPGETLAYRRVRLACGAHVLSEAENWYRPALLTAEMNARLASGETPFGLVVRPLGFTRADLAVEHPWRAGPPPHLVLRHVAVLTTAAGARFSYVVEAYTAEVLAAGGGQVSSAGSGSD
jgi:hypothetical protein